MEARPAPVVRILPTAWAKLKFLSTIGKTEIAGFGIADDPSDPLLITDFSLVKQEASGASFEFDADGLASWMEDRVKEGLEPNSFMRIWIHTHPGGPEPSSTDWETFGKILGKCDWSVMFIFGMNDACTATIQFTTGPGGCFRIPVQIAWDEDFDPSDFEAWEDEYKQLVSEKKYNFEITTNSKQTKYTRSSTKTMIRFKESLAPDDIKCDNCYCPIPGGSKMFLNGLLTYCSEKCAYDDLDISLETAFAKELGI